MTATATDRLERHLLLTPSGCLEWASAAVSPGCGGVICVVKGSGGTLASYLLFEPGFVQSLIAMGEEDARAQKEELLELILGT